MDIRTATRMEKARKQAIAISVFLVIIMLGISTTFIALNIPRGAEITPPITAPDTPDITPTWVMPVAAGSAQILKSADFNMVQYNKTAGWYEFDLGYTIGAAEGTKVVASYDGKVRSIVESGDSTTGKLVRIEHANGLETVYSSLGSITVKAGDTITKGATIGTVGNTSYYETFEMPHVKFLAYKDGKPVNPEEYVEFPNKEDK